MPSTLKDSRDSHKLSECVAADDFEDDNDRKHAGEGSTLAERGLDGSDSRS